MRYKNIYILLAALSLFSCTKEQGGQEPRSGGAITIEASIGALTKGSVPNPEKSAFSEGDRISIYAWTGSATEVPAKKIVNGVVNTFDGTKWTPETQMLWNYVKENHYFLGVYPAKAITNFTADEYTLGPDLLIATELKGIPFKENPDPVALTFTHAMAKLCVNMKFRSQWAQTPEVTSVATTSKVGYTVNYLTKAVTATGTAVPASVPEVTAATGYARSFSGLQVPQEDVTTLTVTIDGKEYIYIGSIPLESGKITTLNLNVGLDKIELAGVSVTPWVEKETIEGGEAVLPDGPVVLSERANCFVVKPGAYVAFDACKGNSSDNIVFDKAGLVWQDNKALVESVAKDGDRIVVKLSAGQEGNAVICAISGADTTWSWNLWVLKDKIQDVAVSTGAGSAIFMDRNVGALSATAMDSTSIGNVYQWGRKDPWAGLNYEGALKKMYALDGEEVVRGFVTLPDETKSNVDNAVATPMTHWYQIYSATSNGNCSWLSTAYNAEEIASADTLWNNSGKKTIYDPCPAGYKVASQTDWNVVKGYATANPAATTKIIDSEYKVSTDVSDKWAERYVYQYSKQVQFRGGKWGPLTLMVNGELSHLLAISKNVGALSPAAEIWTANIDPNFKSSKANFRAYATVLNASWSSADQCLKMGNLNTASGLNLAYELPVRCVKETAP